MVYANRYNIGVVYISLEDIKFDSNDKEKAKELIEAAMAPCNIQALVNSMLVRIGKLEAEFTILIKKFNDIEQWLEI